MLRKPQTRKVMADWGVDVNADTACGNLTVEQRQVVEITRALAAGIRCLLLDEPTAALERGAAQRLFERIRQLQAQGVAILYISHHLEEVFEICTDVAVLRDGELVRAAPLPEVTKDDLVTAMVGAQNLSAERNVAPAAAPGSRKPPGVAALVSTLAASYPEVLAAARDLTAGLTPVECEAVFAGTATSVYRL